MKKGRQKLQYSIVIFSRDPEKKFPGNGNQEFREIPGIPGTGIPGSNPYFKPSKSTVIYIHAVSFIMDTL